MGLRTGWSLNFSLQTCWGSSGDAKSLPVASQAGRGQSGSSPCSRCKGGPFGTVKKDEAQADVGELCVLPRRQLAVALNPSIFPDPSAQTVPADAAGCRVVSAPSPLCLSGWGLNTTRVFPGDDSSFCSLTSAYSSLVRSSGRL